MKVLTAAEMRHVDHLTIEGGIPGIILMENAAHRVVEFLERRYSPLATQRIVVLCGKGNNGGDGLAIARILYTRFRPIALDVVLTAPPEEYRGDAAVNLQMLKACGMACHRDITAPMHRATLVLDAVLGTGLKGPAEGRPLEFIQAINTGFPDARIIAVDLPSGMNSDEAGTDWPMARADACVTFTAPKICHALAPNCDRFGELHIGPIGSPDTLVAANSALWLSLIEPRWLTPLFQPRPRAGHKGNFGHALIIGGSVGKTGAAAMAGMAALRAGAGLATVASSKEAIPGIAARCPELMTEPLTGGYAAVTALSHRKAVLAVGPGLGASAETAALVRDIYAQHPLPVVLDADAITCLAGFDTLPAAVRVLTPHPGEMATLTGSTIDAVQSNRVQAARNAAIARHSIIVLKGQRTLIAFPDGRVWINPSGTPAMGTAGSGDILTGLTTGLIAQFPAQLELSVAAAVWLHGRAGELGAVALGEKSLIATDLLRYLPEAIRELARLAH
ncbi:MAG: NAD(P)H-hydrate dehydratase [Acidobacteria bacterium]|nr:NAD(P)H-hydrate dehydratase [Acidobacteriota bacterium]